MTPASIIELLHDFRFGSKGEVPVPLGDVRFDPNTGPETYKQKAAAGLRTGRRPSHCGHDTQPATILAARPK
jgi:hypothetical protein